MKEVGALCKELCIHPREALQLLTLLPLALWERLIEHGHKPSADAQAIAEMFEENRRKTMQLWKELIDTLPKELCRFEAFFGEPKFSQKEMAELLSSKHARAHLEPGDPWATELFRWEIHMMELSISIHRVSMLINRALRHGTFSKDEPLVFDRQSGKSPMRWCGDGELSIDDAFVKFEILEQAKWREDVAEGMWRWIAQILPYRPYLIEGCTASIDGENLVLRLVYPAELQHSFEREENNERERRRFATNTLIPSEQ